MKARILFSVLIIFLASLIFTSCQKSVSGSADETTQVSLQADDQNNVSSDIDNVANDADVMLEASSSFSGRGQDVQSLLCNATVAIDTASNPRTITITYNGQNCLGNLNLVGVVVISMPQNIRWRDAGAAVTITFQHLTITRLRDNKSITINGAKTYTNVSGGLLINLPTLGTITHTITSSGLSITFDNGSQRSWQVAKQRVFTYSNGVVITTTGTHTDGTTTGISEWGTNRFGNAFTTAITQPLVVRQDCNFRLTSGEVVHTRPAGTATVTFGLDSAGNPTTCPGTGHYYMKIVWVGAGGVSHTVILPY
jgi:hypothetical protein